ncbi:MAG: GAF domain-containing protein, partial [Abditibacteriales bacterium]|nr:GAF domain-containing protein [Abditibacteriales bacterium]
MALRRGMRVLVVDDNLDMLSIVSRLLREAGYEVLEATTGRACWELAQEQQPDLILLDVNLPDVSGIEVCRRLKADPQLSKTLIAHLSATETTSESQVAGLEAGADAYIVYPLSHRELLARVQALARLAWAEKCSAAFARLGRQLSAAAAPEEAAQVIVEVAQDLLGWDACFVDLYASETDTVTPLLRMDSVNGQRVSFDPGPPGLPPRPVARRTIEQGGQLILRNDPHTPDLGLRPFGDVQRRSLSLMFVPIRNGHQVTGVLSIQSYTPHAYTPDDLNTLQALADHCGGALARLASERAQRETDRRLREMLQTAQLIALQLDADGNVTFCNDYLLNLIGYQREELLGRNWFETCLPAHVRTSIQQAFIEGVRAGVIAPHSENAILTRAGEQRLIAWTNTAQRDLQGNVIGVSSLGEDITERKRAEQLQTAIYRIAHVAHQNVNLPYLYRFIHQELSGILDTQNFYIALYDAERNLISFPYYVDENYSESPSPTALERTPRRGLTEYVLRRGQALFAYEQDIRDLAEKGEVELLGTLSRVWLGAPLKSGDKIIGVLAVQSYTNPAAYAPKDLELLEFIASQIGSAIERKRAEEALQETNRRLEHALAELQRTQQHVIQQERLRAIGTMASGIAHDFNNALSPILGYSELLLAHPDDLTDRERVTHYLERIHVAAQDAAHVVSRLREFYRHRDESEVFLPVQLNAIVEQALSLTQPKWKNQAQAKGVTIQIQTDLRPVPPIMGNEADLREVLTNLIFNAVDAMPNGGEIVLRTRVEEVGKLGNWEIGELGNWEIEKSKTDSISQFP